MREASPASPTVRLTAWFLIALFAISIIGSYIAKTEIVARGLGRVVPHARVQLVQPQTAGKVREIHATEGQAVQAGDVLVVLDGTTTESEIKRISAEIERQELDAGVASAIVAPLEKQDPGASNFIEEGVSHFRQSQSPLGTDTCEGEALVRATLVALRDQALQIDAQLNRVDMGRLAQVAKLEKARDEKDIVVEKFAAAETLMTNGTISRTDYLERLRELKALQNAVEIATREADEMAASGNTLRRQRAALISGTIASYRKQVKEAGIALIGLRADLKAAQSRLGNLTLRAPTSGRVENLAVHTIGGFVEAGTTVMAIVPDEGGIEIEAFFDNRDVGFLEPGQKADVKFDAFPAERFGVVRGTVTSIGADARQIGSSPQWVYAVRLRVGQTGLHSEDKTIPFVPGMTVTVDVITGERRLLSYFFEPITKAVQDAMKER